MQITSRIHRNINYGIIVFLGLVVLWVLVVTVFSFAQEKKAQTDSLAKKEPPVSGPVIKPFPEEFHSEFQAAQDEQALRQSQMTSATLRGQNVLYQAALELGVTKEETKRCEIKLVTQRGQNKAIWSFVCPPPEPPVAKTSPVEKATPTPTPAPKTEK